MYIVAQRVISPKTRQTGINVFLYLHPGRRWLIPPEDIPSGDPGRLRQKKIGLEPNGNVVRSHLEVVAPDEIEVAQLRKHLSAFLDRAQFKPLPWKGADGPCSFGIHMVSKLVQAGWGGEVTSLATAGASLIDDVRYAEAARANLARRR
jgi:hypothetical protein